MGKSNSYYMQLHVEALFTMNCPYPRIDGQRKE